jgi:predicted kinase
MSKLFFMIGCPRSGKSTFCKEWINDGPMRIIVCGDDIRMATYGQRWNKLGENSVYCTLYVMIRALLLGGFTVLVDETNSSEMSITRILEIDENAKPILIDTSEDECIKRAIEWNQKDLIPVIKQISRNISRLKDEGIGNVIKRLNIDIKERV